MLPGVGQGYRTLLNGDTDGKYPHAKRYVETATRQPPPPAGRYSTAAEAILVALREFEEDRGPGALMPGGELIKQVTALLEDRLRQKMLLPDKLYPAPGAGAATPCANWGQLSALQALECVEKKARKRECPETKRLGLETRFQPAVAAW